MINDNTKKFIGVIGGKGAASQQVQADWNESDTESAAYIKNKPTIPAAQVQTDWNAASGMGQLLNKPSNFVMGANNTAYTIWVGTQAEYDLLTPDASTVYLIKAS